MEAILKTDTAEISADDLIKVYDTRIEQLVQLKIRYKKLHYKKNIELFKNEVKYMCTSNLGILCRAMHPQSYIAGFSLKVDGDIYGWNFYHFRYCKEDAQYIHYVGNKCNMSHENAPTINTLIRKKRELIAISKRMYKCLFSKIEMYKRFEREECKKNKEVEFHKFHKAWLDKYTNYEEWKLFREEWKSLSADADDGKVKISYERYDRVLLSRKRYKDKLEIMEDRLVRQIDETNIQKKRVTDLHREITDVRIELFKYKPVECPVCRETIEGTPVILSCAHYICANCFSTMVQLNHKHNSETKCHICRTKI